MEELDDRTTDRQEQTKTGRRGLLKKGLLVAGAGAMVSPLGATRGTAEKGAHPTDQFEIWAADHIEIDYRFQANGPVEPISHPADDIGAEIGPGGNDEVEYLGNGKYRGRGRTGLGKNDLWQSGSLDKIVITDCRQF